MSVFGVSHVAIGVADMDLVLPFYTEVLGFSVKADFIQEMTPDMGRELHKGRHIRRRQIWLRVGDDPQGLAIALDQLFLGGPADKRSDIYDRGIHHVSLWVDDIQAITARARAGGHPVVMPHIAPLDAYGEEDDGSRIASCFFRDPEGNLIQTDQRIGPGVMEEWRNGGSDFVAKA